MKRRSDSPHIGRVGEGAESHPVRRETDRTIKQQVKGRRMNRQAGEDGSSTSLTDATASAAGPAGEDGGAINKEREPEITTPQADSTGERAKYQPRQPDESMTNEKENSNMELEPLQQILLALERQRAENAEREAARARENAERDAARAKEIAELRAENAERDAVKTRENAELRANFDELRVDNAKFREELRTDNAKLRAENAERDAVKTRENAELRADNAKLRANFDELRVENAEMRVLIAQQSRNTLFMLAAVVAILGGIDLFFR